MRIGGRLLCVNPDRIVAGADAGYIYWTEMGIPNKKDVSIERVNIDGSNHVAIVPNGYPTPCFPITPTTSRKSQSADNCLRGLLNFVPAF
jgi:hypothetical protein